MSTDKIKVAVFVSGGGTNLQAIIDAEKNGIINSAEISLVVSSKSNAYAITRAENAGIKAVTVIKKDYPSQTEYENALCDLLELYGIRLIVLAGYMTVLSADFVRKYDKKIINIHPSLIPSFCGDGYYGLRVHSEALKRGVKITGATVHYVNEITDGGEIIAQKAVRVHKGDDPEKLQRRVMEQAEWIILPKAIEELAYKELCK